jgi:hypothetical protein
MSKIRFAENNFASLTQGQITYSSELTAFPFSNAINTFRSRLWKPSGYFKIDATNNKLYINDGSNKTITLTSGDYTTPVLLASEMQTKLNASSSGWTVTHNATVGAYKFKLQNSGSVTLRLSQVTAAIWGDIGFITTTDLVGTSFEANEQRNHMYEFVRFDFGWNPAPSFFALIGPIDEQFGVSSIATVRIEASNLDNFDSPDLTITPVVDENGVMHFSDGIDTAYRFWRIYIEDKLNPEGPTGLSIGYLYLGDYVTLTSRNVRSGFVKTLNDPSTRDSSDSGSIFFDRKTKYTELESLSIDFLEYDDKQNLEAMFERLGVYTPFFISLDPTLLISDTLPELTKYVVFDGSPTFTHIKTNTYSLNFKVRELV